MTVVDPELVREARERLMELGYRPCDEVYDKAPATDPQWDAQREQAIVEEQRLWAALSV